MARLTKEERDDAVRRGATKAMKYSPGGFGGVTQKVGRGVFTTLAQKFANKKKYKVNLKRELAETAIDKRLRLYEREGFKASGKRIAARKANAKRAHDIKRRKR